MTSPGFSIEQAHKETQHLADIIEKMHQALTELATNPKADRAVLLEKIRNYEEATDVLEIEISDYLVRVSEHTNLERSQSERIRFMQTMINDMERIADIYFRYLYLLNV